ncbi:MAG: hypothetical protein WC012_05540 [Thiohalomonadaceae bacterium]
MRYLSLSVLILGLSLAAAPVMASAPEAPKTPQSMSAKELSERFGIELQGIRRVAGGYMLDMRYTVRDSTKAARLLGHDLIPQLIDERRNTHLITPAPPKIGPLRQTGASLRDGRTYFVFFANPGKGVKAGDPVSVMLGDIQLEGLTIQ